VVGSKTQKVSPFPLFGPKTHYFGHFTRDTPKKVGILGFLGGFGGFWGRFGGFGPRGSFWRVFEGFGVVWAVLS